VNNQSAKNELEGRTFGSKTLFNILFDVKEKWRSRFKQSFHNEEELSNALKEMELNRFSEFINERRISTIIDVSNKSSTGGVFLPFYMDNIECKE
jgi:hypothetical protein